MNENSLMKINKSIQVAIGSDIDVAGRDIIKNYFPVQNKTMKGLVDAYKKEQSEDFEFHSIIEELNYYLQPVKSEETKIIGLEKKLEKSRFNHLIEYAIEAKDIFARKVDKHRLSKTAQEIFVFILGDIWRLYNHQIYPLILSNIDQAEILKKIDEEIIDKIGAKLEENVLDIYNDCISGMIYFLTGNCHIKWSKL